MLVWLAHERVILLLCLFGTSALAAFPLLALEAPNRCNSCSVPTAPRMPPEPSWAYLTHLRACVQSNGHVYPHVGFAHRCSSRPPRSRLSCCRDLPPNPESLHRLTDKSAKKEMSGRGTERRVGAQECQITCARLEHIVRARAHASAHTDYVRILTCPHTRTSSKRACVLWPNSARVYLEHVSSVSSIHAVRPSSIHRLSSFPPAPAKRLQLHPLLFLLSTRLDWIVRMVCNPQTQTPPLHLRLSTDAQADAQACSKYCSFVHTRATTRTQARARQIATKNIHPDAV